MVRKLLAILLTAALLAGMVSVAEETTQYGVKYDYAAGYNQYSVDAAKGENRITIESTSDDTVYYRLTGDNNAQPSYIEGSVTAGSRYSAEFTADEAGQINVSVFGGAYGFSVCADGVHSEEREREILLEAGEESYGVAALSCALCGKILDYEVLMPTGSSEESDNDLPDLTYSFVIEDDLFIYIDRAALITNTPEVVSVTVLWGEDITEDITVFDENGTIVREIANDAGGYCRFETVIFETEDRMGSFTAQAGEHTSVPVDFRVMAPLTEEMTERLFAVMDGADEYLQAYGISMKSNKAASEKMLEGYLDSCSEVTSWIHSGDMLIYTTADGLTGAFDFSEKSDYEYGFASEIQLFNDWYIDSSDTSDEFIKSRLANTNTKVGMYYAQDEDPAIEMCRTFVGELFSEENLADGWTYGSYGHNDGTLQILDSGAYTDNAITVLCFHGNEYTADGKTVMNFAAAEGTKSEMENLYNGFYSKYARCSNADGEKAMSGTDVILLKDPKADRYKISVTSNYLKKGIGNKVFDNSIVYMMICHGLADKSLTDFMLRHGAACVIGVEHESLYALYGFVALGNFVNRLGTHNSDNIYNTISEASTVLRDFPNTPPDIIRQSMSRLLSPEEILKEWNDEKNEMGDDEGYRVKAFIREGCEDMVLFGRSALTGRVICEMLDGTVEPVSNARITLYKWLNHQYSKVDSFIRTDADGYYYANVDTAHYGIVAEDNGFKSTEVAEVGKQLTTAKDIVLYKEVENRVVDITTLKPIPGATVNLTDSFGYSTSTTTDANGSWRAKVSKYEYTVKATCDGYEDVTQTFSDFNTPFILMKPITSIIGSVTDAETGEGIGGADIVIENDFTHAKTHTSTDGDGNFKVLIEDGKYTVTASAEGYSDASTGVLHLYTADSYVHISLKPEDKVQLSGTVTDKKTGKPIYGAAVRMCNSRGEVLVTAYSDAYGKWEAEADKKLVQTFSYATVKCDGYVTHKHRIFMTDFKGFDAQLTPVPSIDFILVTDTSGSMDGVPLYTLKDSAGRFINDLFDLSTEANAAIIEYNTDPYIVSYFGNSYARNSMLSSISSLSAGGRTDIASALRAAATMASSRHTSLMQQGKGDTRIVVIFMSDGYPTCPTDSVYKAADELHALPYVDVYSVGFFHDISSSERTSCQNIMRYIAGSSTRFFTVSNAAAFSGTFGDVLRSLLVSPKLNVTVDCPVDVSVTYLGETLDKNNTRASFGTLQFEGENNERKVLRLDSENDYIVNLTGTGSGYMDYTIRYTDEDGLYSDTRKIVGIPVEYGMNAYTETALTDTTSVYTDISSTVYSAGANEKAVYNYHSDPVSAYTHDFAATASSYYEQNNPSVAPSQAIDSRNDSSWDSWGEYEGAWISFRVTDGYEYQFSGFTIMNGKNVNKGTEYYYKNSRIKDCTVYIDGVEAGRFTLADTPNPQTLMLPAAVTGSEFKLTVDTVYPGSQYQNPNYGVCVTEINLW